jgi:hypothetical protein
MTRAGVEPLIFFFLSKKDDLALLFGVDKRVQCFVVSLKAVFRG